VKGTSEMQSRRRFIKNTGLLSVAAFSNLLSAKTLRIGENQKKNLLFIITDQQRYDALSIAGNTILETPHLDRLAQGGAYFKNAYTPCAVCGPARSSILTGHTVENTGVKTNNHTYYYEEDGLMTMPTFDEILTENGYHCEYYGKWHSPSDHAENYKNPVKAANNGKSVFGPGGQSHIYMDYLNQNEDNRQLEDGEFYELITKRPYKTDPLDKYYGMTAAEMNEQNLKHLQPDQHGKLLIDKEHTMTAFQARQTIEAIERLKDTPFSVTCSFHYPHSPIVPAEPYYSMYPVENLVPPESIADDMQYSPYNNANGKRKNPEYADPEKIKYMISNYYGLVKEIDDWIGEILDKLDELGLAENTMIIFTSDHGEMLGAHGLREKNIFYEESAHIPLLIRFPNEIRAESTVEGYISLVDLFPTILDYLNIGEYHSDGKSLRGLIEGTDQEHGNYAVAEWDWRGDTESNYMIIKDGWKLIIPYTRTSSVISALYDLNTDPNEVNNLISSREKREQQYKKLEELKVYMLEWLEKNDSKHYDGVNELFGKLTSVENKKVNPSDYELGQNYPNPFNPTTTIHFQLPKSGNVNLTVHDITGRHVATLVNEYKIAGQYHLDFDALNFSSGSYFYRMRTGAFSDTKKLILKK
jgi:arylsulfatase A-like enzyme